MNRNIKRALVTLGAALLLGALAAGAAVAQANSIAFAMVRSSGAVSAGCLNGAAARVEIRSLGPVEVMDVTANKLPPRREFDLFVTQLPSNPFGVS